MIKVANHKSRNVVHAHDAESSPDLRTFCRETDASHENSTWSKMLRTTSTSINTIATIVLNWKDFGFDSKMDTRKQIKHSVILGLVVNSWLSINGIRIQDLNPDALKVINRHFDFISAVDDFIDRPRKSGQSLDFMQDRDVRRSRKSLFSAISGVRGEKEIKRLLIESKNVMMNAVVRMRNEGISSLDDAMRFSSETTSELIRVELGIIDIMHNARKKVTGTPVQSYINFGMVLQLRDDFTDIGKDMRNGIDENFVFQILKLHPEELKRVDDRLSKSADISRREFVRLAPESFRAVKKLQDEFFSKIPDTQDYYGGKILTRMAMSFGFI